MNKIAIAATMAATVARPSSPMAVFTRKSLRQRPRTGWSLTSMAYSSSSPSNTRKLVLYSKPDCCLCDGLKEKLQAAFLIAGSDSLNDVELQVRDITSNPEWEKNYQYEIPVLAKVLPDGSEEVLPRLSPRLGVELVHKKIAAALSQ